MPESVLFLRLPKDRRGNIRGRQEKRIGTRLEHVQLTSVTDGDTLRVAVGGQERSLRVACADTEESRPGGLKPATRLGLETAAMARRHFTLPDGGLATVTVEFDTDDPQDVCLVKHLDNHGRLLGYVHHGGENYLLKLVREGWSPYFTKYGRSRLLHGELLKAEASAQADGLRVWDPGRSDRRPYERLVPWWSLRDAALQEYRGFAETRRNVLSLRLEYEAVREKARRGERVTVLADVQGPARPTASGGVFFEVGSHQRPFSLWLPDADGGEALRILRLLATRYLADGVHYGRGYVYVSGALSTYRDAPQLELKTLGQLSDTPPGAQ